MSTPPTSFARSRTLRAYALLGALCGWLGAIPPALAVEPSPAATQTQLEEMAALRTRVAARLGGKADDYVLQNLPDLGLIEVYSRANARIAYVDPAVRYVFVGSLFDAESHRNLSTAREHALNRIPLASLPHDRAIRIVKGSGKPEFAVFEDPDCPFCRAMEQKLDGLDNYTAYVLLLPLDELHPNASAAAKRIWCASDPSAAWQAYMHTQQLPEARDCATPIAELQQLAHAHRITGTPTLVMPDGEIVEGMPDLEAFKSRLDAPSGASH